MKINVLAALVAVLFGVSYAASAEAADPISLMENDLGQATAELASTTPDGTPIDLTGHGGCGCGGCCSSGKTWTAGVEATYLFPDFEATTNFELDGEPVDFNFELEAAPRVWLGFENCNGVGVRGRYWLYDAEASVAEFDIDDDDFADGVFATSQLGMYTIDVEATKRFCRCGWDMLGSIGVRNAELHHEFGGVQIESDASEDESDTSVTVATRNFNGTGITAALEGSRPYRCSGLSLYWNTRGSVLWGENNASSLEADTDVVDGDVDLDNDFDSTSENATVFIGEVQVGAEWKRSLKCVNADVFVRAVVEAQWWFLGTDDALGVENGVDPLGNGDLALYGCAFSAGISR